MFFYSATEKSSGCNVNVWIMNGTKQYLRHYDNYLFLDFVTKNPRSNEAEKRQARAELGLCEKKLEFWKRHPNYVHEDAIRGILELKKNWNSK